MERLLAWIFWGVLFYFLMIMVVAGIRRIFSGIYSNRNFNLIILTLNSSRRIEWMVWSYQFWNSFQGRSSSIVCLDLGSVDDTLDILNRLQQRYPYISISILGPQKDSDQAIADWLKAQEIPKDKTVVLDLRESSEPAKQVLA